MSMAAVHHGYYKCEGSGRMIRKIMQTAAVFLLTGVLAVTAVTTYVTVPDEPAADEETQAEEAGTIESVTASSLADRTLYLLQSAPMTFSTNARALCRKFSIQIRNSRAPVKR